MEKKAKNNRLLPIVLFILFIVGATTGGVLLYDLFDKPRWVGSDVVIPTVTTVPLPQEVTVRLTKDGFTPRTVTIKKGSVVRWVNESNENATVNSDDHPTNQKYKNLNLGSFGKNSTLMLLFNETGSFGYHDHFHPLRTGTIVVIQ